MFVFQHSKWDKLDKCEMNIMDALFMLDSIIDESDPDVSMCTACHHVVVVHTHTHTHTDVSAQLDALLPDG